MSAKQRSRLVTFRVSVEEYEELSKWCRIVGARSISEFARAGVRQSVQALRVPSGTLTGDLGKLVRALSELDAALGDTQNGFAASLGPRDPGMTVRRGPTIDAGAGDLSRGCRTERIFTELQFNSA